MLVMSPKYRLRKNQYALAVLGPLHIYSNSLSINIGGSQKVSKLHGWVLTKCDEIVVQRDGCNLAMLEDMEDESCDLNGLMANTRR